MPERMTITVRAAEVGAATAYRRISDFAGYPHRTGVVREVVVREADPGSSVSDWTLGFGSGLLRWTQRETFDPRRRTIAFTQLSGDFVVFDGSWRIDETAGHAVAGFEAVFDLGIPALAELLDPIVESALRDAVRQILDDLLGPVQELEPAVLG
jgi:ribosome-associated toxin RatA of RatAB toxin-antitoxin module